MNKRAGWRGTIDRWRPSSVLRSLDLALADPPLLCCDDDELCPACRIESQPMLVSHVLINHC